MIQRNSLVLVILLQIASALPAFSCFTPILPGINRSGIEYTRINIQPSAAQLAAGGSASIVNGFDKWNYAPCQSDEAASWIRPFPVFSSSLGSAMIDIVAETDFSSDFIGLDGAPANNSCVSITLFPGSDNALIRLHTRIKHENGDVYKCNWDGPERVALQIAHELGHYLGLRDSACHQSIMGPAPIQWNSTNNVATHLMGGHSIHDYECQKADEVSISPSESDYEEQQCFTDPTCDPYAPCWSDPGCTCPILLDLDRNQFHLTDAGDPVLFDIDADGKLELLTWTAAGTDDAFLCWDRNGNGRIDDGSELFGNSTRLADDSIAPFGYIALSELDAPWQGGNGDGVIDARDAIYGSLCAWTDTDHDGETDAGELRSLASAGVVEVDVNWTTRSRQDAAGNLFLYHGVAKLEKNGKAVVIRTSDVYFVDVEPEKILDSPQ